MHYQPQLHLRERAVTGLEALVRWEHPERGLIAPGAFISLAEESGLIVPLGNWVLREVGRQMRAWIDEGRAPGYVAVNLCALQLGCEDLVDSVRAVLEANRLAPGDDPLGHDPPGDVRPRAARRYAGAPGGAGAR